MDNGYKVYINASSRYANFAPKSEDTFREEIDLSFKKGGQPMGVFVEDKLVAYAMLYLKYRSLRVATSFFDPAYSNMFPMYALYYTIAHIYLQRGDCEEINNGNLPLLHETNIGDFLLRLGWRKAYRRLGLYLVWFVRVMLSIARTFRKICKLVLPDRHYAIMESLLRAQDIAKATSKPRNFSKQEV